MQLNVLNYLAKAKRRWKEKKKLLQLGPEKQGDPGKGGARSRVHVDVHKNNAFISRRTVKASLNFRVSTSELPGFA